MKATTIVSPLFPEERLPQATDRYYWKLGLLLGSSPDGEFYVCSNDTWDYVQTGQRAFPSKPDSASFAWFLEALDDLERDGLTRRTGEKSYVLTARGYEEVGRLREQFATPEGRGQVKSEADQRIALRAWVLQHREDLDKRAWRYADLDAELRLPAGSAKRGLKSSRRKRRRLP